MFWDDNINVHIASYSFLHIEAIILNNDQSPCWHFVGFYRSPMVHERRVSWELLSTICGRSDLSVLIEGDWNEILHQSEKVGGVVQNPYMMQSFGNVLIENGLVDFSFQGFPFTWHRGHPSLGDIMERLDRYCASQSWIQMFSGTKVWHLPWFSSDHSPILWMLRRILLALVGSKLNVLKVGGWRNGSSF